MLPLLRRPEIRTVKHTYGITHRAHGFALPVTLRWSGPVRATGHKLQAHDSEGDVQGSMDETFGRSEADGNVKVQDDLDALLEVLPQHVRERVIHHEHRNDLIEVILDLGRRPEARFQGLPSEVLADDVITRDDLAAACLKVGDFGGDNRAGIEGKLHRISAIRNRKGTIVGLTCRVGRAVTGHVDMIRDLLELPVAHSILFLGRPGVGKTTVIRELARTLSDDLGKRVVIIDTSNEIGGDGDIPHPAIGSSRRMQVPVPNEQHHIMIEAVENHMPEVIIVDEIGTEAEALACRTIAERGVQLIGTAHGQLLENLIKNPTLSDLVGGIQSVTLGDDEARSRNSQKTILERAAPPTFPIVLEMRDRTTWVTHWVEDSIDALLRNTRPMVQVRRRDPATSSVTTESCEYDAGEISSEGSTGARGAKLMNESEAVYLDGPASLGGQYSESYSSAFNDRTSDVIQVDDAYAWAQRLQELSDEDALSAISRSKNALRRSSNPVKKGGRKIDSRPY